ncbi:hypothetical protein KM1_001060 [Entamoeba histolytica HM-3:IMSS]|uniref:Uncharacterized protein n=1 Tax=Entamoeba histolytica HM-3:IMSS TaxID=885315 RepID=M7X4R6_ENTHI|nr:hypothetical protein KM1_001060 [Entamoeba histolytica HM-3:IMSS]
MKSFIVLCLIVSCLANQCKCELVEEDGTKSDSYKCNRVEDFSASECTIFTSLESVIGLPNNVKELVINVDEISIQLTESCHIEKLVVEDFGTEVIFKGDGYLSIDLITSENPVLISTSISMDIVKSECKDLSLNSLADSVIKFSGSQLDEVYVQGILQISNTVTIKELTMLSNGYLSIKGNYEIQLLIIKATEFILYVEKKGTIKALDTKQLDLSDQNIDICLIKSLTQEFPELQLPANLKGFELKKCCAENEIHLKKEGAQVRCTIIMCSLGKVLEPSNCFEIQEKSQEDIPISITLTQGYDLNKIKNKKIYQLVIPEELHTEIDGSLFEAEEIIVQGESTLKGKFNSIVANSLELVSAEVNKLNVIGKVTFDNVKLTGFIDLTDSQIIINGVTTFERAQIIASSVNIFLNNKGSIFMNDSKMMLSSGVIYGSYESTFKGWIITNSKVEIEGVVDINFDGGHDNLCKRIIQLSSSDISFSITSRDNSISSLVLDTSKTGIYACYEYNNKPIYTLENCKTNKNQLILPDDTTCTCDSLYCNYIVEGKSIQITEDIGGIEGNDLTIKANGISIDQLACFGECTLVGDFVVRSIKQQSGPLNIKGQILINTINVLEESTIIKVYPLAILTLETQVVENTKIFIQNRGSLELTTNNLKNSLIEIEETGLAVVYDSNLIISSSTISLSNVNHNAFALGPGKGLGTDFRPTGSTISFSQDSSIVIRGEVTDEVYLVYGPKGSILNVPQIKSVVNEQAFDIKSRIKCGTYIVANAFKDDVVCPKQPFNLRGVNVVLVPKKWNRNQSYLMMLMFSFIGVSGLLVVLFIIYSLIKASHISNLKMN